MPEVIARHRLIIGGGKDGKERRTVMPGQRVNLDRETVEEIRSHQPEAIQDVRAADRRPSARETEEAAQVMERVAPREPEPSAADGIRPMERIETGNVTREQPPGAREDDDEL